MLVDFDKTVTFSFYKPQAGRLRPSGKMDGHFRFEAPRVGLEAQPTFNTLSRPGRLGFLPDLLFAGNFRFLLTPLFFTSLFLSLSHLPAEEVERSYKVTSFFMPEREAAIREAFESAHEGLKVKALDFKTSTITLQFAPNLVVPRAGKNLDTQLATLNQMIRGQTKGLIAISELPSHDTELLEVTIPVAGLDCIGCSYAAYDAVQKLEGVEYCIASFKEGRVFCRYDSTKTDPRKMEAALLKLRITLNYQL